jgi:hypothetical protein
MSTLTISRGDDRILDILVTDEITGLPVDLTGMTLWFYVKRAVNDADALALIAKDTEVSPGGITIDPDQVTNTGEATVTIDAIDTDGLAGTYKWGLQGRDALDKTITLAKGNFVVEADLVRA